MCVLPLHQRRRSEGEGAKEALLSLWRRKEGGRGPRSLLSPVAELRRKRRDGLAPHVTAAVPRPGGGCFFCSGSGFCLLFGFRLLIDRASCDSQDCRMEPDGTRWDVGMVTGA